MIEANNIWDKKVKNDGTEEQEIKRDGVGGQDGKRIKIRERRRQEETIQPKFKNPKFSVTKKGQFHLITNKWVISYTHAI